MTISNQATKSKRMHLTKSLYANGVQCPKLMWLKKHEPDAPELEVDEAKQHRFDIGNRVGELARSYVPGGILIEKNFEDFQLPIDATQAAISGNVPVIYEAAIQFEELFCAVDILERSKNGWNLVEVKSATKVKDAYMADIAIQTYIARKSGLNIERVEVMTLNSGCRYPNLSNLFARHDVTEAVNEMLVTIGDDADRLLRILKAAVEPEAAPGPHCKKPYDCPFYDRCNPVLPEHHVSTLYRTNAKRTDQFLSNGIRLIADIPEDTKLSPEQSRQRAALKAGKLVIEGNLKRELKRIKGPIGFLDFETAMPAIPVLQDCGPYTHCAAQFSYHVEDGSGGHYHHEWIATGKGDPRRPLAEALVKACQGTGTILSFFAQFESKVIENLAVLYPDLADALNGINERVIDLLPIVRNHVYHPQFYGSFSIKKVLPALCPELTYEGMAVGEGQTAARLLEVIITAPDMMTDEERIKTIEDLKAYCKLDTWAMVALHKRLLTLAV